MDSKLAILLIVVAAVAGYFVADNMGDKAAKSDKAQATKSAAAPASSSTLAAVKKRGQLVCGVSTGLPGFSQPDTSNSGAVLTSTFVGQLLRQSWETLARSNSRRLQQRNASPLCSQVKLTF